MHFIDSLWWLHMYALGWEIFLQALWIALQLKLNLSFYWYGIFVPTYVYVFFLCCWVLWLMLVRLENHWHHRQRRLDGMPTHIRVQQNGRLNTSDLAIDDGTLALGGVLYQNSSSKQHYTPDELLQGLHEPDCYRRPNEGALTYFVRRNATWANAVRVQLVATAVVTLVLVVVRLENPTSSYPWWVVWLVISIMGGVMAVLATIGAFAQPVYAWWERAVRSGAALAAAAGDGGAGAMEMDGQGGVRQGLQEDESAYGFDGITTPGSGYEPDFGGGGGGD